MKNQHTSHPIIEQIGDLHTHAEGRGGHAGLDQKINQLMRDLESGDVLAKSKIEVAILARARNKVKDLLAHEYLQHEDHTENRSALEKIKNMLHPMQVISKMYDYEAEPPSSEKVDLGINWQGELKMDRFDEFYTFDEEKDPYCRIEERGSMTIIDIPFLEVNYNIQHGDKPLRLEGRKRIIKNKETGDRPGPVIFELTNPNIEKPSIDQSLSKEEQWKIEDDYLLKYGVANFAFKRTEHKDCVEWDMNDRITSSVYRGQGIAAHVLQTIEQTIAKDKSKSQILKANTGQADVLIWLINAGYKPETPEDQARIDRLMNKDENLVMVSSAYDEGRMERRQNYIFEKDVLFDASGKQRPEIWDDEHYGEPIYYMKSSLRINLRKKLN